MLIVDIETSSPDPDKGSIASIGAVDFLNPKDTFYGECKVFDGAEISEEAMRVNGFNRAQLLDQNKQSTKDLVKRFLEWVQNHSTIVMAGHMTSFDSEFIKRTCARYNLNNPFNKRIVDIHAIVYTHMLSRGLNPPLKDKNSDLNSDKVMEYVGIPSEPKPHIAINGAIWEAEVLSRLIHGKPMFEQFENHPIPEYLKR